MSKGALILFVKNPIPGKVKTRIAATAGAELALRIYKALLSKLRYTSLDVPFERYAYLSGSGASEGEWPEASFHIRTQKGKGIGTRMLNAFKEVLADHDRAILVGSDIPALTPGLLQDAMDALVTNDLVLGPARDGGYYLIGLCGSVPALFDGISWSSASVFSQTLEKAKKLKLSVGLMPMLSDVDTEEDWLEQGWNLDD